MLSETFCPIPVRLTTSSSSKAMADKCPLTGSTSKNNAAASCRLLFAWRKVMTATDNDRDILARTRWGEARGESLVGQIEVAWTIRNRVNHSNAKSWWGEGYVGVCQKPYQFSCRNKNDPNYSYLSGAKQIPFRESDRAYQWCYPLLPRRLRIAGSCRANSGNVPGTVSNTSLANGGTVGLALAAGRAVFDIHAGIIADQAALKVLQAYVMNVCR